MTFNEIHYQHMSSKWEMVPSYTDYMVNNWRFDKPSAAVIDLDGTLKSDHPSQDDIYLYVQQALLYLQKNNITIFLVTARAKECEGETISYLRSQNIDHYFKGMYFLPEDYTDIASFKSDARDSIREDYSIIMCFGDRNWDLSFEDDSDEICLNILFENPFIFE